MEGVAAFVGIVIVFCSALIATSCTDEAWHKDCEKLGKHLHSGLVFECREVKP